MNSDFNTEISYRYSWKLTLSPNPNTAGLVGIRHANRWRYRRDSSFLHSGISQNLSPISLSPHSPIQPGSGLGNKQTLFHAFRPTGWNQCFRYIACNLAFCKLVLPLKLQIYNPGRTHFFISMMKSYHNSTQFICRVKKKPFINHFNPAQVNCFDPIWRNLHNWLFLSD